MVGALLRAVRRFGLTRGRRKISAFDRHRIVSMVDDGRTYACIRDELGFRGYEIDLVLRQHAKSD